MIYVFDIKGKLIDELESTTLTSRKYSITQRLLCNNILRKSLFNKRYYFSRENYFHVPNKGCNHNPLLAKSSSMHDAFTSSLIREVDSYFRSSESSLYYC